MDYKKRTQGLFYPLMLLSVGFFMVIVGSMTGGGKRYARDEFQLVVGSLTEDANNIGPYYRTFYVDSLGGTLVYVRDRLLSTSAGPRFSQLMNEGAKVEFHVPRSELQKAASGDAKSVYTYGLVANGEVLIDLDAFILGQDADEGRTKVSFVVVGGVMLLGGLLLGWSKLAVKTRKMRHGGVGMHFPL